MITWSDHQSHPQDDAARLEALRAEFPDWGFVVIRQRWVALRGKTVMISAPSAAALRTYLREAPEHR